MTTKKPSLSSIATFEHGPECEVALPKYQDVVLNAFDPDFLGTLKIPEEAKFDANKEDSSQECELPLPETSCSPWKQDVQILSCYLTMTKGRDSYFGSGHVVTLIDEKPTKLVLTAGHNLYSKAEGWMDYVTVMPSARFGTPNPLPSGVQTVPRENLYSVPAWIHEENDEYDLGVIVLPEFFGSGGGYGPVVVDPLGLTVAGASMFHYPAASRGFGTLWTSFCSSSMMSISGNRINFRQMYAAAGTSGASIFYERYRRREKWIAAVLTKGHPNGACESQGALIYQEFLEQMRELNERAVGR